MSDQHLLEVEGLEIAVTGRRSQRTLVHDVSFHVAPGEAIAIVGESGSGKTLTALTVMGLLRSPNLQITGGSVRFQGMDLLREDPDRVRKLRGSELSMIYQDPMTSLNPLMRVGKQITEAMTSRGIDRAEAEQRALEGLIRVGIPDAERALRSFPHQFSGGMRQRIMIALALILEPNLLLADEPTTALDVTIQQQILAVVQREQRSRGMGLLWITHDLGVVAQLVDRVIVMYSGTIVETGNRAEIFRDPKHPYTQALIGSIPTGDYSMRSRLTGLPMDSPPAPVGACAFKPRCVKADAKCLSTPRLVPTGPGHEVACFNAEVMAS